MAQSDGGVKEAGPDQESNRFLGCRVACREGGQGKRLPQSHPSAYWGLTPGNSAAELQQHRAKHPAAVLLIARLEAFLASGASHELRSHPWRDHTEQQGPREPPLIGHQLERDTGSTVRPEIKCCRCLGERGGDSRVTGTADPYPREQGISSALPAQAGGGDETAALSSLRLQFALKPAVPSFPCNPLLGRRLLLMLRGEKCIYVA